MFKNFFDTDEGAVSFLASINIGASGVVKAVDNFEPVMHFLLVMGQIVVAAVTAICVWRKARAIRTRPARKHKQTKGKKHEENS